MRLIIPQMSSLLFVFMWFITNACPPCLQTNPVAVSRGVSQPDRVNEEPADLFSEEEAGSKTAKSNGVHSDDDNDLFAG